MKTVETKTNFRFINNGEKVGAIDEMGEVLPCIFDDVAKIISLGYWIVKKDGMWGYYSEFDKKFIELPICDKKDEDIKSILNRLNIKEDFDKSKGKDMAMKLLLRSFLMPSKDETYKILSENPDIANVVVKIWRSQADYKISRRANEEYKAKIDDEFYNKCAKIYSLEEESELDC